MSACPTAKSLAVVVGAESPVSAIVYHEPILPDDSGFTVLFADAPKFHLPDVSECQSVCLGCLINTLPEDVGRGFDLARSQGFAKLDSGGEWTTE